MKKPALVVLAAGMGSRYGSLKQVDPVGPAGETVVDYSVYDALRAGFGKVVFVIRRESESDFRRLFGRRFEDRADVRYAHQELDLVPAGCSVPAGRKKPWGTGHAVLAAADAVEEPFAVINSDDFYGRRSYELLHRHLLAGRSEYALVAFELRNTLSEHGTVCRGVCECNAANRLRSVRELTGIERAGEDAVNVDERGNKTPLPGGTLVSMGMWGFTPSMFDILRTAFSEFVAARGSDPKAEFYLPVAVDAAVRRREATVKVLRSPETWFGVTYREDRRNVVENIAKLVREGVYPAGLRG